MDNIDEYIIDLFNGLLDEKLSTAETQKEIDEIMQKIEGFDLSSLFSNTYSMISKTTTEYMRETMFEEVMRFRADEQEFLARQEQIWYKAFVASESMYIMTLEATEEYIKRVNKLEQDTLKSNYHTFLAMQHIHGRALQQFLEIIVLMKNGFADGAYARWRSMYELAVVASFIIKHGEKVAEAFIQSSETEDRYDWARTSEIFPSSKKHITFNDIQKNCELNTKEWRKQYNLANKIVHASSQGTFARLGNMGDIDIIPVGRSDYGITTAAEHSAISLANITAMFLSLHPSGDSIVAIGYITSWINVIREMYFKTHDEVFVDKDKLWDDSLSETEE